MIAHTTSEKKTIWGLGPIQLHDRFWAARGIQVVRLGEPTEVVPHAELYLLSDPRTLSIFRVAGILDTMCWLNPSLVSVRLIDPRRAGYREHVVTDDDGRFTKFERIYARSDPRMARVAITHEHELAMRWQSANNPREGWRILRSLVPIRSRYAAPIKARVYDATSREEVGAFVRELVQHWRRPDAAIRRIHPAEAAGNAAAHIWADESATVGAGSSVRGPLWIGAGRALPEGSTAVGPAVLWDAPEHRPVPEGVQWLDLESIPDPVALGHSKRSSPRPFKRVFDFAFALVALLLTLPLYPLIALAILLEDGRPIFFAHKRETLGGREFGCIKFRSMRKDAEKLKLELAAKNQADGPQFFMENDPRLTKVGRFIRKLQLDELPQFLNVLRGDMSVVGPRPSPFKENQYCPPWRDARLSVRPGVTGLWQISRTRAEGTDFQEWIKFDIEYVENQSFWLDLWIIWQTVMLVVRKVSEP